MLGWLGLPVALNFYPLTVFSGMFLAPPNGEPFSSVGRLNVQGAPSPCDRAIAQESFCPPTLKPLFGPRTKDLYGYWYGKWYEVEVLLLHTAVFISLQGDQDTLCAHCA